MNRVDNALGTRWSGKVGDRRVHGVIFEEFVFQLGREYN